MAEKNATPNPSQADAAPPAAAPRKKRFAMIGAFGAVMLVEGLAIFLCIRMFRNEPDPTMGLELPTTNPWEEKREIEIVADVFPNIADTRVTNVRLKIVAVVDHSNREKVELIFQSRQFTVRDAINRLIREATERELSEAGLETLRRKVRFVLNELVGDDALIEHVLIPECRPYPTGL